MTLYFVAEKLCMTVAELQERMTYEELVGWVTFIENKNDNEKKAIDRARRRR